MDCLYCQDSGWIGHVRCSRCAGLSAIHSPACQSVKSLEAGTGVIKMNCSSGQFCRYCWPNDCGCF